MKKHFYQTKPSHVVVCFSIYVPRTGSYPPRMGTLRGNECWGPGDGPGVNAPNVVRHSLAMGELSGLVRPPLPDKPEVNTTAADQQYFQPTLRAIPSPFSRLDK